VIPAPNHGIQPPIVDSYADKLTVEAPAADPWRSADKATGRRRRRRREPRGPGSMTLDELRTHRGDADFHRARRMFCIRNGKLAVAPEGTAMSHLEWFESEGWVTTDNAQAVMDSTVRGIFLPARHALFFYRGIGFFFDAGVVTEACRWAEEIMSA